MSILITGGAGALGAAVARELSHQKQRVTLIDRPEARARAEALAKEIDGAALLFDVSTEAGWSAAISELGEVEGAALISGAYEGSSPLHATHDDAAMEKMHAANFATVYRSLRALLPGMVERGRGSIVVIGSRAAVRPWESAGAAPYAASKAAVIAMAQAVAQEVLPYGVRVNALLPSIIDTPANRASMPKSDPSRWVSSDGLAKVVAFLLSDDAREITGAAIPVYGRV